MLVVLSSAVDYSDIVTNVVRHWYVCRIVDQYIVVLGITTD